MVYWCRSLEIWGLSYHSWSLISLYCNQYNILCLRLFLFQNIISAWPPYFPSVQWPALLSRIRFLWPESRGQTRVWIFSNAFNLTHSIFQWTIEIHSLFRCYPGLLIDWYLILRLLMDRYHRPLIGWEEAVMLLIGQHWHGLSSLLRNQCLSHFIVPIDPDLPFPPTTPTTATVTRHGRAAHTV